MSSQKIPARAKLLCAELVQLAEDRESLRAACRAMDCLERRIEAQQEDIEQKLMDMLNSGESEVIDIGRLRLVFQTVDQYNSKPWFEVRYQDYSSIFTKRHYLRKPGNKRKKGKS